MMVTDKRLQELMKEMMDNQDGDGFCRIPEDITPEEEDALYRCLTITTMHDRLDTMIAAMQETFGFISQVKEVLLNEEFDTMDKIKYTNIMKGIKENAQTLLMDLYSPDKISNFFLIDMITDDTEEGRQLAVDAKEEMEGLCNTKFKEDIDKVKGYCEKLVQFTEEAVELINA